VSYDPDDISELFSEDVAYRYHACDEPIVGRMLSSHPARETAPGDASTRDAPGT